MAYFRKKPVVIEAVKWTGNMADILTMGYYYHKNTGAMIEAMQYRGVSDDLEVALFVCGRRRTGDPGFAAPGDWIIKIDNESYCKCPNSVFIENYNPLPNGVEHSPIPQPKQWPLYKYRRSGISVEAVQWNGKDLAEIKAFAGEDKIRWDRISLQYYIYSMDTDNTLFWSALKSGDYIYRLHQDNPQNIAPLSIMSEWLFTSIFTPITNKEEAPIGRFVVENTSSRRDIGLLCEQAARHIQRRRQAA